MRTLRTLVVAATDTNLDNVKTILATKNTEVNYETDIERAIDAINNHKMDLLIVDLDLPKTDYKKVQTITDLMHPDAAITETDLNHIDYISFKMDQLIDKWMEANSDSELKLHDNPAF
ncbi:ANTAR domain-containing protein [Polluticaenibacter yanchengensis]|uniref:Response regulatory domain-containing protein n=1 Tax=Polluticaenibacter yanchengensis TaxID=3014562 RepID=A0ABT4ULL0_9BACT|nr:hypothetical protein [Chitinophagaceae bacterium LY-5]